MTRGDWIDLILWTAADAGIGYLFSGGEVGCTIIGGICGVLAWRLGRP